MIDRNHLTSVISIVQNGIDFATPRDVEIVRGFCEEFAQEEASGDPALLAAEQQVCQCGFCESDIREVTGVLRSWRDLERALKSYREELIDKIVSFLTYWFGACNSTPSYA
jgi:hypothetical protein